MVPGLSGATGRVGPTKGVAIGDAVGCGDATGDGSGEADVVGGDGAGIGFAGTEVCGVALGFAVDAAGVVCVTVVA